MSDDTFEIEILSLRKFDGHPNDRGDEVVALLDVRLRDFDLRGCCLIRKRDGSFALSPPTVDLEARNKRKPPRKFIAIRSEALREQLLQAACKAYRALGGLADEPSPEVMDAAAKELAAWLSR